MKKILMLGGSAQQVPAIEAAREMGYYTVLIDYLPDNPGQLVADKWYQESTTDIDAVYRIAKEEEVSGILPYASDPAALPAAIVAERLGLPTNPSASVEILGVKHKFRRFLQVNGFASPQATTFNPSDTLECIERKISSLRFPIIIKPTDSSGSKGVTLLDNIHGLSSAICHADEYSRNKIIIAEEFIERGYPYVIGGDIFVTEGKIILFGNMACMRDNGGKSLIPIGKRLPDGLNKRQTANLRHELQRLVSALHLKGGEMNIEIIVDKDDNIHFLELGPRAGGNMIPIQLSDAYGVDLIRANISVAMGDKPTLELHDPGYCYLTHVLHSHINGEFQGIEFSDEIKRYIYRKVIYKKDGDKVSDFDGAGKAIGIIFMRFDSEKEMGSIQEEIDRHIHIILK